MSGINLTWSQVCAIACKAMINKVSFEKMLRHELGMAAKANAILG